MTTPDDEPTCGKGPAEHASLPAMTAQRELLERWLDEHAGMLAEPGPG